jgi:broad-specificity NMP kinase
MQIKISDEVYAAAGSYEVLKNFNPKKKSVSYNSPEPNYYIIKIDKLANSQVRKLKDLLVPHIEMKGAKNAIKDIDTWLNACAKPEEQKARTVEQFGSLLIEYMRKVSGQRLYEKDKHNDLWLCYYVADVKYEPPEETRDGMKPARVRAHLAHSELEDEKMEGLSFYFEHIHGYTVSEALAKMGYYPETEEKRKNYLIEVEKFEKTAHEVGKQYLASGFAKEREHYGDVFGFPKEDKRNRVVIDIFSEGENDSSREVDIDPFFWKRAAKRAEEREKEGLIEPISDEETDGEDLPMEDSEEETPSVEIPIHPTCVVFDLQRHLRLNIHVNLLEEYTYDKNLSDKLILPIEHKNLVKILIEHKSGSFKDIVAGKDGGVIILLTGKAGTGKTLTAEVYAESEEKPLYTVQASQLGTDADELEKKLLEVMKRAARWKAILLIDEADVYVHVRGNDIQQNAIVGVLLRVLEYHASVLFLTTNRPDLVDDAIASRCVARIDYEYPSKEDQMKIWRVLADSSGVNLSNEVIAEFASKHTKISGRDVKNILKLSRLIEVQEAKPIDLKMLEYAMKFNSTIIGEKE